MEGNRLNTNQMSLRWHGTAIEICMGRITAAQKRTIEARCAPLGKDLRSGWYDNTELFRSVWRVDNWWSVDDVDHVMGPVFEKQSRILRDLSAISIEVDGAPTTIDPESVDLRFYAPETVKPTEDDGLIVFHGARREATVTLQANCRQPFDSSLLTLSFMQYEGYGNILIDMDYDGYDDVHFSFGQTTYLQPRFLEKDAIDAITG
jgi:hypothetical protein